MPASLQTPEKKADLIAALASSMPGERHRALIQLAGWDEDDEVATALRPLLQSEDVFEASQAANGLARQADVTDLPALVDLVRRMSPSDGGTCESMLLVLPPALDLAKKAGPVAIDGLRQRTLPVAWRSALPGAALARGRLAGDRGPARAVVAGADPAQASSAASASPRCSSRW